MRFKSAVTTSVFTMRSDKRQTLIDTGYADNFGADSSQTDTEPLWLQAGFSPLRLTN